MTVENNVCRRVGIQFRDRMASFLRQEKGLAVLSNHLVTLWFGVCKLLLITVVMSWNYEAHAMDAEKLMVNEGTTASDLYIERSSMRAQLSAKYVYKISRDYATKNLPNETYQAYPIPVRYASGVNLVFLWGISRAVPGEGRHYISPHWMVAFESSTGEVVIARRVLPSYFGLTVTPGQFIGTRYWKNESAISNRRELEDRLYRLYDELIPYFTKNEQVDVPPAIRNAALEFREIFRRLSQQFLRPYYCAVGRDFYTWVDDAAKSSFPPLCAPS